MDNKFISEKFLKLHSNHIFSPRSHLKKGTWIIANENASY
tara:strand:- start:198 stop:317 length:120 start_codon:yes stop_codon:yes gene_type:complete